MSIYRAAEIVKQQDGVTFFLAGDAAFGVPFFRALNCGMVIGSKLAYLIPQIVESPNRPSAIAVRRKT
jgi:hypothetical protein